ncbi:alpha-L-glutamate ligase [Pelagibius sp. 7325]|uniref:ATP-grasp domain-containing protein n=1 Tax=Pelagibius sp. 7325 TaxID=3131994 RepID=UPI0030EB473F
MSRITQPQISRPQIHVLHENPDWLPPLAAALERSGAPWDDWFLVERAIDLAAPPPEGVFYNRMSASSHTRGHRYSAELTAVTLAWLTQYGRRVVNGPSALDLEISKVRQYAALARAGVATPRTVPVVGKDKLVEAARNAFGDSRFLLKPNRGGKGLGVRLLENADDLAAHLETFDYEAPLDGVHLLQDYVVTREPIITRAEFVGGRFLYAVEVDTSNGFELCPADVCSVPDATRPAFQVIEDIDAGLKTKLERFLQIAGIEIAGIEFATGADGRPLVYDVNTNTNYNSEAEAAAGVPLTGMDAIARYLKGELARSERQAA